MRFVYVTSFLLLYAVIDIRALRKRIIVRAYRVKTKIYPDNGLLATKVPITNGQPITFFKDVADGELYFAGDMTYRYAGEDINVDEIQWYEHDDLCAETDYGDWYEIMKQVLRTAWFPDASCPVEAGNYTLKDPMDPIEMNVDEVIDDYYEYKIDVEVGYSESRKVLSATYAVQMTVESSFGF
ncbi:uncharacterized protein [Venturia canescens]|uniref:uncharacterized protein isoform X2 n=1 Tax=Venturia canescens TaxID=32260 RepID=UPI001C9BD284|nr:uncharacterized protein LOC122417560 isoform X2 [Venturia canescens]